MKRIFILTIFFIFLCSQAWATTYFVRDDGNDGNTGLSDAQAWDTIAKVNGFAFNAGDDVYFKCDDTFTDTYLIVDWAGTSGNKTIIGAYEGNGDIVLEGDEVLPIFDGNDTVPGDNTDGLVTVENTNYVTVQDLHLKESGGYGVWFYQSDNGLVDNVTVARTYRQGVYFYDSDNCILQDSNISETCRYGNGAVVAFKYSDNVLITRNKIYETSYEQLVMNSGREGINFLHSDNSTASYNVIYDCKGMGIYFDHAQNATAKYNLIYYTADTNYWRHATKPSVGFAFTDEVAQGSTHLNSDIDVFGNLIAACGEGIVLWSGSANTNDPALINVNIYNNTIVEPYKEAIVLTSSARNSNSNIKNNIFWKTAVDAIATVPTDAALTFGYNHWSHAQGSVDDDAEGTGDVYGSAPGLLKTSGWHSLTAGAVDGTDFAIQTGSNCIDAGINVGVDYSNILNVDNSDFTAFTFELRSQGDYGIGWDIGADVYMTDEEDPPVAGNNDFSEAACIGWWKYEGDATDSKGSDDLGAFGNPTYSAANGDRAVILDGNDALYLANLTGNITGDFTIYRKFKFDAELTGDTLAVIAGEWAVDERCWYLGIKDSATGDEDQIAFGIGTNNGNTANHVYDTSFDLVHNTIYNVIATYDNTNDDVHIWIYDVDGSNRMDSTDNDGSVADDINNENTEFSVGRLSAGTNYLTGRIYEGSILTAEKGEADALKMAQGTYSGLPISVQSATATAGTITAIGDHSITLVWDREPDVTIGVNGPPYFWANAYDGVNYAKYEYVEKSGVNATYTADLTVGMRSTASGAQAQLDFKAGETSIICPSGTAITDMQDLSATLTGLDSLDVDNETYIAIPGIFTVGTSGLFPLWSDGSMGFHDILHDVDEDEIRIKTAHEDEYEISADNVYLRGTGGNLTITGGCNLLGDDTNIRCVTFSNGITDNGNPYTFLESCKGGVIE